jgi:hypothetical protein
MAMRQEAKRHEAKSVRPIAARREVKSVNVGIGRFPRIGVGVTALFIRVSFLWLAWMWARRAEYRLPWL